MKPTPSKSYARSRRGQLLRLLLNARHPLTPDQLAAALNIRSFLWTELHPGLFRAIRDLRHSWSLDIPCQQFIWLSEKDRLRLTDVATRI